MTEPRMLKAMLLTEWRSAFEFAALPIGLPLLTASLPRGDGHTVVVVPGLLTGDTITQPLRSFLRLQGYDARGWGLGTNLGLRAGVMEQVHAKLNAICESSGGPISLIGWSLGGIVAREFARSHPNAVRQVISLGSPLYGAPEKATNIWGLYRLISGRSEVLPHERGDEPPPVRSISIYTRSDGIVAWRSCVEKDGPASENIEVRGASHTGLGVNPLVLYAVADRLGQPQDAWQPFSPPRWARAWFPATTQRSFEQIERTP